MTYDLQRDGDTWLFLWREFGVGVGVDQLHEGHDGLHCEITVNSLAGERTDGGLLHWARLNLSSTTTRSNLAKHLASRDPSVEWPALLEIVCSRTAIEYRAGSPVLDLREVTIPDGDRYLVWPLLPADETTILFGPGGSQKSTFALALALSATTGVKLPGFTAPAEPTPALLLDWESNEVEHAERLVWLSRGMGLDEPPLVHYRRMVRSVVEERSALKALRARLGVRFVIYDSIAGACLGDLNDAQVAVAGLNAMRDIGGTRLGVAHMSAEAIGKDTAGKPFGSVFFTNYARSVWEVRGGEQEEGEEGRRSMGLYHRKCNRGRLFRKPLALDFFWGEAERMIILKPTAVEDDPELAQHAPVSYRIREALRRGAKTTSELAEILEATEKLVVKTVGRMNDVGRTDGLGRGKEATWGLQGTLEA